MGLWLKIAGIALAAFVLLFAMMMFMPADDSQDGAVTEPEPKSFYDVAEEDEERLRAPVSDEEIAEETPNESEAEQTQPQQQEQAEPEPEQAGKPEFTELNPEERADAEKFWEMALQQRKMGRLPGMTFGKAVEYARTIIEKYPDSEYAYKARRLLADLPYNAREKYNITAEETAPF